MRRWIVMLLLLSPVVAFAQDVRPTVPQTQPCEREVAPHPMGGIDADVLRCQVAFASQQNAELSEEVAKYKALYVLASKDFTRVKQDAATRAADLAQWFSSYFAAPK